MALCVGVAATLLSSGSQAAPITRTFAFTAADFTAAFSPSPPPPQDPVSGSITLTFDPSLMSSPSPDANPDSIALTISGHSYTAEEVMFNYAGPAGAEKTFQIGVPPINIHFGATNDFLLGFTYDPDTDAAKPGGGLTYTTPAAQTEYHSGSFQVTVVPEPTTAVLVAMGLAVLAIGRTRAVANDSSYLRVEIISRRGPAQAAIWAQAARPPTALRAR